MRKFQPIAKPRGRFVPACVLLAALSAASQAQPPHSASGDAKPKIQVNFLNPCRPPAADVEEISRALAEIKDRPAFTADFEIARGVTTLSEAEARATGAPEASGPSRWVRIRHEFPEKAPLSDAQFSLSSEGSSATETLALHPRESKQVLQVTISDTVTGTPLQVLQTSTPPDRIAVERYGKASLVLARCPSIDQSAYEPIFRTAGEILDKYRVAMSVKSVVPAELARLPGGKAGASKAVRAHESKASGTRH